jgi:hypothetical protein
MLNVQVNEEKSDSLLASKSNSLADKNYRATHWALNGPRHSFHSDCFRFRVRERGRRHLVYARTERADCDDFATSKCSIIGRCPCQRRDSCEHTKPLIASKLSSSPTETVYPSEGLAMEKDFTSMEIVSETVP